MRMLSGSGKDALALAAMGQANCRYWMKVDTPGRRSRGVLMVRHTPCLQDGLTQTLWIAKSLLWAEQGLTSALR